MVSDDAVIFEALCQGSLNWRVSIGGVDDHVAFANRDTCIAAATARARRHHLEHFVTTQVWARSRYGERECLMSFMTPCDFEASLDTAKSSLELRHACDRYELESPRSGSGDADGSS
jgi:hypothetical protein